MGRTRRARARARAREGRARRSRRGGRASSASCSGGATHWTAATAAAAVARKTGMISIETRIRPLRARCGRSSPSRTKCDSAGCPDPRPVLQLIYRGLRDFSDRLCDAVVCCAWLGLIYPFVILMQHNALWVLTTHNILSSNMSDACCWGRSPSFY
ncbi:hypothetical protein BD310DRAFT_922719 [Dichomitus squalens]|uniref:Uncharacterized protein n=1 Tax=Dichomitus squalens TaxID=114155 RepID=A0A4Q9Q0C3_9APHY|nr:hypothetical protein BD310DRAFT_922719 [Dichomitus squalens]